MPAASLGPQASREELKVALKSKGALLLDGANRLVDEAYLGTLLELLLLTIIEQGWADFCVPATEAADALTEHGFDHRWVCGGRTMVSLCRRIMPSVRRTMCGVQFGVGRVG